MGRLPPLPPGTVLVFWASAWNCQVSRIGGRHSLDLCQSGSPKGDSQLFSLAPAYANRPIRPVTNNANTDGS